jgi:hypothetical protein
MPKSVNSDQAHKYSKNINDAFKPRLSYFSIVLIMIKLILLTDTEANDYFFIFELQKQMTRISQHLTLTILHSI